MAGKAQFPTEFVAEFRGYEPGREFPDKETGELVQLGPVLKLERELIDGDVEAYALRCGESVQLDVEPATVKKGDKLRVRGDVVLYEKRPGYFKPLHVGKATGSTAS